MRRGDCPACLTCGVQSSSLQKEEGAGAGERAQCQEHLLYYKRTQSLGPSRTNACDSNSWQLQTEVEAEKDLTCDAMRALLPAPLPGLPQQCRLEPSNSEGEHTLPPAAFARLLVRAREQ